MNRRFKSDLASKFVSVFGLAARLCSVSFLAGFGSTRIVTAPEEHAMNSLNRIDQSSSSVNYMCLSIFSFMLKKAIVIGQLSL